MNSLFSDIDVNTLYKETFTWIVYCTVWQIVYCTVWQIVYCTVWQILSKGIESLLQILIFFQPNDVKVVRHWVVKIYFFKQFLNFQSLKGVFAKNERGYRLNAFDRF